MNIIEYSFVFSCYFIPGVADESEYNIVCLSAAGHGHRTFLDAGIARCDIVFHTDVPGAARELRVGVAPDSACYLSSCEVVPFRLGAGYYGLGTVGNVVFVIVVLLYDIGIEFES